MERGMEFRIYRWVGSQPIWLKSLSPLVKWGPHEQARKFASKGEALQATRLISFKDQPAMVVEEASRPDPFPVGRDQASE
jgi:hypothetical protein